ncbi:glycosyltransferase family 2 protein [Devosia sp. CN2-171]|uniref:glycosyltransferase family 2 protein n=1 Tax=Devosia sp. CN2-171 TaxID=3400909 RepID=UPI003BF8B1E0
MPAVAAGIARPAWSVMIPIHNAAKFLGQTLRSVLAQDQGSERMQIVVVDDASDADDPEEIVSRVGGGRVQFVRQPRNVGLIANFQTCLELASGEFVHQLHGDDWVEPGFYEAMERGFLAGAGAAFSASRYVDDDGIEVGRTPPLLSTPGFLTEPSALLAREQVIMTPSMAVRRSVYEALGGFDRRLAACEDWEMWVRISSQFAVWHDPNYLACYRMHRNSSSAAKLQSGADMAYARRVISMMAEYVPADVRASVQRDARRTYAYSALGVARRELAANRAAVARAQAREAVLTYATPTVLARAASIAIKSFLRGFRS